METNERPGRVEACGFSPCGRPAKSRGLCNTHYEQRRRRGYQRPIANTVTPGANDTERFWNRVDKNGPESPFVAGPCWTWTGLLTERGYGRAQFDGRVCKAHQISFRLAGQTVPDGLELMHLCHNAACVNPAHLKPGTHRQNMIDAGAIGRMSRPATPLQVQRQSNATVWGGIWRTR